MGIAFINSVKNVDRQLFTMICQFNCVNQSFFPNLNRYIQAHQQCLPRDVCGASQDEGICSRPLGLDWAVPAGRRKDHL